MCNGTFQHNFQPLEKETEIAISAVANQDLQIGVCVCVCVSLPWVPTEMCMTLEGLLVIPLTVNKLK